VARHNGRALDQNQRYVWATEVAPGIWTVG
jgi:hypothetical protein